MTDPQFKELCGALQFHNGHMKYLDFVANFEDLREVIVVIFLSV